MVITFFAGGIVALYSLKWTYGNWFVIALTTALMIAFEVIVVQLEVGEPLMIDRWTSTLVIFAMGIVASLSSHGKLQVNTTYHIYFICFGALIMNIWNQY